MTRKKQLEAEAIGSLDDAFFVTELIQEKAIEPLAHVLLKLKGSEAKLKTIKKRDKLRKTLLKIESKAHATHSPAQRLVRKLKKLGKTPYFDTKLKDIKKIK